MEKWVKIKRVKSHVNRDSHDPKYDYLIGKYIKVIPNSGRWDYVSVENISKENEIIFFQKDDIEDAPFTKTELWKALEGIE